MTLTNDRKLPRFSIAILVILLTAFFNFAALGPYNYWWLLWIAPLPVMLYSLYEKKLRVLLVALLGFGIGYSAVSFTYYFHTLLPWQTLLPYVWLGALTLGIIVMVNGLVTKKLRSFWAVLFFPALMVVYEYACATFVGGLLFPAEGAFTQYPFLSLIQLVSVTGIWGIVFLLNLFPAAIAIIWFFRREKKIYLRVLSLTAVLLIGALIFGHYELAQPLSIAKVSVGLAADPIADPIEQFKKNLARPEEAIKAYAENVAALGKLGAQYVLQPEYSLVIAPNNKLAATRSIGEVAQKYHTTVLFAHGEFDAQEHAVTRNSIVAISPQGKIITEYNKQHLVGFFESKVTPGATLAMLDYKANKLALAICHDMDYINPARDYGKLGVGVIFAPAADFGVDKDAWWHARIALVQSIANGYSLARAAAYGYLTLSDYHGRIIAQAPVSEKVNVFLIGSVPVGVGETFYARHGDWFAWFCLVMLLGIVGLFVVRVMKK